MGTGTSNIEHRTLNIEMSTTPDKIRHSTEEDICHFKDAIVRLQEETHARVNQFTALIEQIQELQKQIPILEATRQWMIDESNRSIESSQRCIGILQDEAEMRVRWTDQQIKPDKNVVVPKYVELTEGWNPPKV
jgi:hypothetical protein